MIIVRSPLRVTLGGGGTDLPSYCREHDGFLIAAAIDKYVYITLHRTFQPGYIIKYSELERVKRACDIRHPIVGAALGSSGSFTTALLRALHTRQRNVISPHSLAEQACHIEVDLLREPVGKQDQFIAAYGGVTCFEFNEDDSVKVTPAAVSQEVLDNLEDGLSLFFTGYTRAASAILKDQDDKSKAKDASVIDNLHYIKDLGRRSHATLLKGDLPRFAELMDEHWQHKKKRSGDMSNSKIDGWYEIAKRNGALGGKLIGAGGGGFLMFYTENKRRLLHAMLEQGLEEVRFRFDFEGSKTMIQ